MVEYVPCSRKYQRAGNVLVQKIGDETLIYETVSGVTHLLQSEHAKVYELIEGESLSKIAELVFPDENPERALGIVQACVDQLLEREVVREVGQISRRAFSKGAVAMLPAILTFVAPLPAAADSLGTWEQTVPGDYSVMVPARAMSIIYTVKGGDGGGGGGGGFAIDSMGGTMNGIAGGDGALGVETTMSGVAVTGGSTLSVMVGAGGSGGSGGGDGTMVGMTFTGGAGGGGGIGAINGDDGIDGGGDANLARGGGGGGGGRGGDSVITTIVTADGGAGGGGGEGGMGGMGMVASMDGAAGVDGNAGGAGGMSGGTATDGGNGGGFGEFTPTASGALGGTGSTGFGSGNGGDGNDGSVSIVFCA